MKSLGKSKQRKLLWIEINQNSLLRWCCRQPNYWWKY